VTGCRPAFLRADGTIKPAGERRQRRDRSRLRGRPRRLAPLDDGRGASVTWKPRAGYLFFAKASEEATFTATATPTKPALKRAKTLSRS
jgi:hypothetical protein